MTCATVVNEASGAILVSMVASPMQKEMGTPSPTSIKKVRASTTMGNQSIFQYFLINYSKETPVDGFSRSPISSLPFGHERAVSTRDKQQ